MAINRKQVQGGVDPLLTAIANDYANNSIDYIGDKLFPIVKVAQESGTYYTYTSTKDRFTIPDTTKRAVGGKYGRGDLNVGTSTYTTNEDGWEIPVDRRLQDNAVDPLDPWKTAIRNCADVVLLRREYDIVSAITNATTFGSYTAALAAGARWDEAAVDVIDSFYTYAETVRGNCGLWPNTLVIDWATWLKLSVHPVIVDRLKITSDKIVTTDLLARLFNIDRVLVSKAKYNSAQEGKTVSLTDIMSKKAFLAYVAPSPAIDSPSVGYLLQKEAFIAESYEEVQTRSDVARARINEVSKIVAADCGYLLTTVIS